MIIGTIVLISEIYNWQWANWQPRDWYILISVLAPIFIIILYLSSVPEQKLYNFLQNKLIGIAGDQLNAHKKRVKELEKEYEEFKSEYEEQE